jgi:conjugal transfer pilus assembly protein TraK
MSRPRYFFVTATVIAAIFVSGSAIAQSIRAQAPDDAAVLVQPEKVTAVEISNTDVNRVICPSEPKEIVYSKEKGLTVTGSGRNLFIKFLVTKKGEETFYNQTRNEIYVTVGGDVYSLILYPRTIPGQTIWLQESRVKKWEEVAQRYSALPEEAKIIRLIKEAYKDTLSDKAVTTPKGQIVENVIPGLVVSMDKEIHIEGQGMKLRIFTLQNNRGKDMQLSEKFFLVPAISRRPLAVSLEKVMLERGERGRLFVVEKVLDKSDISERG